ncbi:hypothetical protein HOW07_09240 [Plantibacter sp. MCCC 1A11337]|uniref:hypothetical protein n=1 Tax=Plantibacter sp. MCCC 1A11337 TaxID=2736644 RepID=UPI0015844781|nr:hypothetical protein [Plantibacter sp. MCCC 1A11337]NUJ88193.1 hypothetical protein [Plantibacter sp. MCCC 1A11337]
MASFTPGRPRLAFGIGIVAVVLGVALIPVAVANAHGEYGFHFWWIVIVPILAGLYFGVAGAVALRNRR